MERSMSLFRLEEYNRAAQRRIYEWINARTDHLAPSLRMFPTVEVEQVRPTRISTAEGEVHRIVPIERESEGKMNISAVVEGNFDQLRKTFDGAAQDRAKAMVAFWQKQADRGLLAGAVAKGKGPPSWGGIMDALEELEISFDDAGAPMFQAVGGPKAAAIFDSLPARTPAEEERWQALMARKQEEWRARKRNRRLA
jgi:hypothetical protein